jgi:ATP-dependent RNA helicase SUPV3L1/SUV3
MNDGTFGTTADERPLDPEVVSAVEAHKFEPLTRIAWRNTALRFNSVGALLNSLDEPPPAPGLIQTRDADDHQVLRALSRNAEVAVLAANPAAVRLLWEVCQIPDFRKMMSESHARFLAQCFLHLAGPGERLPTPWIASQIAQLDRVDGDIDTLMMRIAHIRTWTYITHRTDWVERAADWQDRARGIEDRLSDALHESITQRFVDRRSAFLVRHLAGDGELLASVDKAGEVRVEGSYVGRLDGFRFIPDASDGAESRMLANAASRVLRGEIAARARQLTTDDDKAFALDPVGNLGWRGGLIGRLIAGDGPLAPRVDVSAGDFLEGPARERVRQRLQGFVKGEIERRLKPLFVLRDLPMGGVGRGLAFQLVDALGCLSTAEAGEQLRALDRASRRALARVGVRFGAESLYVEPLLGADSARFRALLWAVRHGRSVPPLPGARSISKAFVVDPALPISFYAALGRRVIGGLALRPDRLERLSAVARQRGQAGPFGGDAELAALAGVSAGDLQRLLVGLGYRSLMRDGAELFVARPHKLNGRPRRDARPHAAHDGHPFAKLKQLKFA